MVHSVFISYSSADKPTGDAVCAALEGRGIRCWMAPRDILPGSDWGEAIVEGIEGAKVFVLVFSRKANESQQVKREVERAVNRGLVIIPLRIEDVLPGRQLEYFLGTPHWLDALTAPLAAHLTYLGDTIQIFLERGDAPAPRAPVTPGRIARATPAQIAGVAVGAVVVLMFIVLLLTRSSGGGGTPAGTVEGGVASGAIDSKFVGSWALVADPAEGPDQWSVTF
ncbi:MAG: toll/interleukin-1 receptor domain-containing protein, partial [Tepidiformaceae bacterium]